MILQNYQVEASMWNSITSSITNLFSKKKVEPTAISEGRDLNDTVTGKNGELENAVQVQEQKLDIPEPSQLKKFWSEVDNISSAVSHEVKKSVAAVRRGFKNLIHEVHDKLDKTKAEVKKYLNVIVEKVSKTSRKFFYCLDYFCTLFSFII